MNLDLYEVVAFQDTDMGYAAETAILVCGEVIGYVGASRYTDLTREVAERVVRDVFMELLAERIKAHPEVNERSRFYYDPYEE